MNPVVLDLAAPSAPEPGVTCERRSFFATLAAGLGAGLGSSDPLERLAATPREEMSFAEFLAEAVPLAKELVQDASARGQQRYLHALAAWAVLLAELEAPETRPSEQGQGTAIGVHPGGEPFTALHWTMEPGAEIREHAHTYGNVVTICLGGSVRVRNYELVEHGPQGPDWDRDDAFLVRRTVDQELRPGGTNLVSLERDYIHGFVAGPDGAHGLDLTTRLRPKRGTPYLVREEKCVDEARRLWRGRWTS